MFKESTVIERPNHISTTDSSGTVKILFYVPETNSHLTYLVPYSKAGSLPYGVWCDRQRELENWFRFQEMDFPDDFEINRETQLRILAEGNDDLSWSESDEEEAKMEE